MNGLLLHPMSVPATGLCLCSGTEPLSRGDAILSFFCLSGLKLEPHESSSACDMASVLTVSSQLRSFGPRRGYAAG